MISHESESLIQSEINGGVVRHIKMLSMFFLAGLVCSVGHSIGLSDDVIDSYFKSYNHPDTPGASVLVMQEGRVLYKKGYGVRELKSFSPVTESTNFRLASVSKQFTATAILLLVEKGLLSFETRLSEVIPEFPSYGERITIRHLLNHTSGLIDYETLIPSSQSKQLSDEDVLNLLQRENSTYFHPGAEYRYSNGGYVLLGLIIERVTGQKFSSFLKENIFSPIGMNDSLMYEGTDTQITNRAFGHSPQGSGFKETDQDVTSATRGDGGVYSSVNDWVKWEIAIHDNLILSSSMQEMVFTQSQLNDGSFIEYGFGWMLDTFKGLRHQYHTGSTIGFRTAVERFPQKNLTVLVLVNRANSAPWSIARSIAQRFF